MSGCGRRRLGPARPDPRRAGTGSSRCLTGGTPVTRRRWAAERNRERVPAPATPHHSQPGVGVSCRAHTEQLGSRHVRRGVTRAAVAHAEQNGKTTAELTAACHPNKARVGIDVCVRGRIYRRSADHSLVYCPTPNAAFSSEKINALTRVTTHCFRGRQRRLSTKSLNSRLSLYTIGQHRQWCRRRLSFTKTGTHPPHTVSHPQRDVPDCRPAATDAGGWRRRRQRRG